MINFLLGVPGSGKSYEAVVFHIIPALNEGRLVITNMPLNLEHFRAVMPDKAALIQLIQPTKDNPVPFRTLRDYGSDWRHPDTGIGPLYVIDECHKSLPRGSTMLPVEEWYAEHRHELADVLLITQSYGKLSKAVCDLVDLVYRCRKNTALGSSTTYTRKVQDGIRGEVVNTEVRKYRPEFFPFYTSHTKSSHAATEALARDIKPIWRHWSVIGGAVFLAIGLIGLFSSGSPFKSHPPVPTPSQARPNPFPSLPAHSHQQSGALQYPASFSPSSGPAIAFPKHPFYRVEMHIAGSMTITTGPDTRYVYTLTLSQNGQHVGDITDRDLLAAGYHVETYGPCMIKLSYQQSFADYLTCDSPRERIDTNMPGAATTTEGGPRARGVASVGVDVPGAG